MKRVILLVTASFYSLFVFAQSPQTVPAPQSYGKVDMADLELKTCDFEKDANAEVLFEKGDLYFDLDVGSTTNEIFKRIKIFNENGKKEADIHLKFWSGNQLEYITGLQAETINLNDGKIEITKLDKKSIFTNKIDKQQSEIVFSLSNVKAGSIIEFKYKLNQNTLFDIPSWEFQGKLPVKYSEFSTSIPDFFYFRELPHYYQPLVKRISKTESRSIGSGQDAILYSLNEYTRGMANIPSLPDEPYMSSFIDNVERVFFQLVSIKPPQGFVHLHSDTWAKVGGILADDEDFGGQLKRKLTDEETIVIAAKALKSDDEKIAYIFNQVKNIMKWNEIDRWYTIDGTVHAWEKKTGNSAEINLILYHLLKQAGLEAYPMVVSTRDNGRVREYYTSVSQFNRAVVYIPVDSAKNYILDATGKYNSYNETPAELLNSSGLYIDKTKKVFNFHFIRKDVPARETVFINAEVKGAGKIEGTADISSTSYERLTAIEKYKTDGEKKYTDFLRSDDNTLKISAVKFENMDVDTLPLTQHLVFSQELTASDENYVVLNANLFNQIKNNPFLSENRMTNIDFAYPRTFIIAANFKIPPGFKTEALPKSINMVMPDKSVTFKRFVAESEGVVVVRFNVNFTKAEYKKDDYADFHEFLKKMYELLNEPVIFKKS